MADTSLSAVMAEIKSNPAQFYVYVMSRPCGTPFYVGVGQDRRVMLHEWEATTQQKSRKLSIIRKLLRSDEGVRYRIDSWFDERRGALARERELVALFGRLGRPGAGTLANVTAGGDDTDHLMAKRWADEQSSSRQSNAMREKWKDPEFRKRHAASMQRAGQNPSVIKRRSLAAIARWADPEVRIKILASRAIATKSEAHRQRRSAASRSVWQRDGHREKMLEARAENHNSAPGLAAMRAWLADNPDKVVASIKRAQEAAALSRLKKPEMFREIAVSGGRASANWAKANPERAAEIRRAASLASGLAHKRAAEIRKRCIALMTEVNCGIKPPGSKSGSRAWLKFEAALLEIRAL
jgi:hypothetical protein